MKNFKKNSGITLIALIITIVILLILAVVTIMEVTGDGIISKAKEARTRYEDEQVKENTMLENYLSQMEGIIGNNTTTGETSITWTDNGDGTISSSNGKTVQIGDTLTNEEVLQATGGTQSSYTGTWTVFGVKNGKLKLISTSSVESEVYLGSNDPKAIAVLPNGTDYERSIWSYKNAVNTLNTVAQTATGIPSAESVKIEDIYDILGEENIEKGTDYGKVYNYYYDTTNSKVYSKYQTGTDENGDIIWSTGEDTGKTSQIFVNNEGKTIVIDSAGDEITLTNTYFYHRFAWEQAKKISNLPTEIWLASTCRLCHNQSTGYMVRWLGNGEYEYITSDSLFDSWNSGNESYRSHRVCGVVYI